MKYSTRALAVTALSVLALGTLALGLPGCGGGGGGGDLGGGGAGSPLDQPPVGDASAAPAISFTIPAHATLEVPRNLPVQVQFAVKIDPASVQPDSLVVEGTQGPVPGTLQFITGDLLRFVPDEDLPYGDTYRATLRPGVRDLAGQGRSGDYIFAFRAVEAQSTGAGNHESNPAPMFIHALATNQTGDGMSLMSGGDVQQRNSNAGLRFRRVRGGVPTGAVDDIVPETTSVTVFPSGLDVAPTGDAQCVWFEGAGAGASAFICRFDRGSDSWGVPFELTSDPGVEARAVTAELNNNGGLVAWLERDTGGSDGRVRAGRYQEGDLSGVVPLGPATGFKSGLKLSRRGVTGVVAFYSGGPNDTSLAMAARFTEAFGFGPAQTLDSTPSGLILAAEASFTGHLYVLFERENEITGNDERFYLSVANPGQPFGPPIPLHEDISPTDDSAMAVGDNGILTVVFSKGGANPGVFARRYTPGQGLSAAVELTGLGQSTGGTNSRDALKVQADARGNAVAVMTLPFGDGQRIRAALLPVGEAATVGIALSDEPGERPFHYHVSLAFEPSGGAFIAWKSRKGVPPLKEVMRTRRLRADGTLGQLVTSSAVGASLIQKAFMTMTTEGRGLILFHRSTRVVGDAGNENVLQVLID